MSLTKASGGGTIQNITAGLNWYTNPYCKSCLTTFIHGLSQPNLRGLTRQQTTWTRQSAGTVKNQTDAFAISHARSTSNVLVRSEAEVIAVYPTRAALFASGNSESVTAICHDFTQSPCYSRHEPVQNTIRVQPRIPCCASPETPFFQEVVTLTVS